MVTSSGWMALTFNGWPDLSVVCSTRKRGNRPRAPGFSRRWLRKRHAEYTSGMSRRTTASNTGELPDLTARLALLDAHREALAACRRCAGLIPPEARPIVSLASEPVAMLVGQAPGKVEISGGRPFAGRSGQTLFRWFEDAGMDEESVRSRIYLAAVTRCFPGPHPSGRGDRVPSPVERVNCRPWLEAELAIIRPRLLIPVGRLAVDHFLGKVPLSQVVGRAIPVEHPGGVSTAVALPHPSGASGWLNTPEHRKLLNSAIGLLQRGIAGESLLGETSPID